MKILAALLILLPAVGLGQTTVKPLYLERLDPVDCLLAVEPLSTTYRTQMQLQCFTILESTCTKRENLSECLDFATTRMQEFYTQIRPQMPKDSSAKGFAGKSYTRRMADIDASFTQPIACSTNDEKTAKSLNIPVQQWCEFATMGAQTIDLLYRARLENIDLSEF